MYKTIVMSIFVALMAGVIFLAANMKEAYKILPGPTSSQLTVPPYVDWREFIPQSGKFKVKMPAVPQYAKESANIPGTEKKRRYEMYAAEKLNGSVFMISLITYPADFDTSNTKEMLHGVVDELVTSNPDGRLISITDTLFQAKPAVDFQFINKDFQVQGEGFMVDKTIYLLSYVARKSDIDQHDYQHFISSFELLPQLANKS